MTIPATSQKTTTRMRSRPELQDARRRRAERDADAEFARALRDVVADETVDTRARRGEREQAEEQETFRPRLGTVEDSARYGRTRGACKAAPQDPAREPSRESDESLDVVAAVARSARPDRVESAAAKTRLRRGSIEDRMRGPGQVPANVAHDADDPSTFVVRQSWTL